METNVTKKNVVATRQLIAQQSIKNFEFKDTSELGDFSGIMGQNRAVKALHFGLDLESNGYNIYIMGEPGTGKTSYVRHYLSSESAKKLKAPNDWVYVNNFENSKIPKIIKLSAGKGIELKDNFFQLINNLMDSFPDAFENPVYQQKKSEIERKFHRRYDAAIDLVEQKALKFNIALFRDANSITFAPMKDGKAMEETAFALLPDKVRKKFNNNISILETMLNDQLAEMPQWRRSSSDQLRQLNFKTIDQVLDPLLQPLKSKYKGHEDVLEFVDALKKDLHNVVMEHLSDERTIESREDPNKRTLLKNRYLPNVIVENKNQASAPVIFETHPNYRNLFGCIEYTSDMGALVTNYSQICAGSLHRANGGFLILEANKLLDEPGVWEPLKRALKEKKITIEPPSNEINSLNTFSLSPENIPLDVKIILIGSRQIYYLMQEMDHDFHELFRVLVDFDGYIERTSENILTFAKLLKNRTETKKMAPITAKGVAKLVEQSSRIAEHQQQLTAHIGDIFELLTEAEYIRKNSKGNKITHNHINSALAAKASRNDRICKEMLKDIVDGSTLIDTEDKKIGKINGLTVLSIGSTSFGSPARITATVYPGSQGIVDIEREAQLGQAIHSKGVMILTGYLGSKYAQNFSMNISANIAMEQSYGYIDGDSAALAELCCLISALTKLNVDQSFAVTGSINQYGEVQAVGGVNEKIEGFFDLCNSRGLTGRHGVIIPKSNIRNLMLDERVIEQIKKRKFTIYAVETVDEALEIIMNKKPGKMNAKGLYPKGTINNIVMTRLQEMAEINKDAHGEE